ncbi:MAG TPA: tyrosine-type recombinase/integrase, partial [Tissierellaceae bacterium]|nr:tyrosine-type recombinase/integrase [Tissierellaceae bacterium]
MDKHLFKGPFKTHIENHIELKQAIGYKYETEANHLLRFSTFTDDKYPNLKALTKEVVLDWCSKKNYESQANQCSRASIVRQLGIYMDSIEINAYILPKGYYPTEKKYIPYIYTEDELKRFFHETDNCHYISQCPYRHLIMPIFFRMIYSCGLRSSEARLLKVDDVDLDLGILTIEHSKKDNTRLVPFSDEIMNRIKDYFNYVHMMSKGSDYFFPGLNGKPMTLTNIYRNFRRFLWKAGISHGGRGKGPRVHDFRHAFACHCLKKWVIQGKDLSVYLPVIKTYLGHDSFEETAYYLRMTADVFPDISIKLEGSYPDII